MIYCLLLSFLSTVYGESCINPTIMFYCMNCDFLKTIGLQTHCYTGKSVMESSVTLDLSQRSLIISYGWISMGNV